MSDETEQPDQPEDQDQPTADQPFATDPPTSSEEEEMLRQWQEAADNPDLLMNQMDVDSFFTTDAPQQVQGIQMLISPPVVKRERLHMVDIIGHDICEFLMSYLRSFLSSYVEVSVENNEIVRFGRYLEKCPLPTLFTIFDILPWKTQGLIRIDSGLLYSLINVSLGGRSSGLALRGKIEGRAFTAFELSFSHIFSEIILHSFIHSFSKIHKISFHIDRQEILPKFAMITSNNQMTILLNLKIDFAGVGGHIEIAIPLSSLEAIWDSLTQTDAGEKGVDNMWQAHFSQQLFLSNLTLTCSLPPLKSTLSDVLSWSVGSVIPFDSRFMDNIHVKIGDHLLGKGKIGKRRGKISVKLKE